MIVVKQKMKKSLLITILAATLAVLIAGAVILTAVINARSGSGGSGSSSVDPLLPTANAAYGEYDYGGTPYAFYPVERTQMEYIQIRSENIDENGESTTYEYSFLKNKTLGDEFVLSYTDESGKTRTYLPNILAYDSETSYLDLYATDNSTGYNVPILYWLCSGIGNIRFSSRIELSTDAAEREEDLKAYGLAESDTPLVIRFNYNKSDKVKDDIILQVGDVLPTGSGYYFRVGAFAKDENGNLIKNENGENIVEYRNFVYTTYEASSLSYAFLSFASFINPILIAEGLSQDNAFEPYLTTDYKQWKNTLYMNNEDKGLYHKIGDDAYLLILDLNKYTPNDSKGGVDTDKDVYEFNLDALLENAANNSLYNALKAYEYTGKTSILVTLPNYDRELDLTDADLDLYTYEIVKIDAVLTDGNDATELGTPVSANDKIKVSYKLKKNGEYVSQNGEALVLTGVLDLTSQYLPEDAKSALVGKSVGDVEVSFYINYGSTPTVQSVYEIYIDEIIDIRSTADLNKTVETVAVGTTVSLRVYDVIDGKKADTPYTVALEIKDEMTGTEGRVKDAILGKPTTRKFDVKVESYVASLEVMQSFATYEISEIKGYVAREEIVAFRYTQDSDRDVYYGESIYTNTMLDTAKRLYALESTTCEAIVQVLGGLLESATASQGLKGDKTVDVVITPEKMLKYGLYANTIYFELPRNILPISEDSNDYTWINEIGFYLYISDEDPVTKTRYIASDMYDIIVEIDGEGLSFLDESFYSIFVRRNLILTSIENIKTLDIEFFTDEISGKYTNNVVEQKVYAYGDKLYGSIAEIQKEFGEDAEIVTVSLIKVKTGYTASHDCGEVGCSHLTSLLQNKLQASGADGIYLHDLYDKALTERGEDYLGTDCFREFLGTLFNTIYQDSITDENRDSMSDATLLMRMKVDLGEEYTDQNGKYVRYVYEFYRVSDRRVAVRLYKENSSGSIVWEGGVEADTADYYISSFAFKKIVSKYWELVNAKRVDKNEAYTDYDIWN